MKMKLLATLTVILATALPSLAATTWPAGTNTLNQTFYGTNTFIKPLTALSVASSNNTFGVTTFTGQVLNTNSANGNWANYNASSEVRSNFTTGSWFRGTNGSAFWTNAQTGNWMLFSNGNILASSASFSNTVEIGTAPMNYNGAIGEYAIDIHAYQTNSLANGGSHAIRDESTYDTTIAGALGGYASYDANAQSTGTNTMNHFNGMQSRAIHNGTGLIDSFNGFDAKPTVNGPVTVLNGLNTHPAQGGGTIFQYNAILLGSSGGRATYNYGINQQGTMDVNTFSGPVICLTNLALGGYTTVPYSVLNAISWYNPNIFIITDPACQIQGKLGSDGVWAGQLAFITRNAAHASKINMLIDENGNVSIGTTNGAGTGSGNITVTNSAYVGKGIYITNGIASFCTNATMVTTTTGCTNMDGINQIIYVTAATGASLTDNAGTTEFSSVTIAAFTPIRIQPGGKFLGTAITYAAGTASHGW